MIEVIMCEIVNDNSALVELEPNIMPSSMRLLTSQVHKQNGIPISIIDAKKIIITFIFIFIYDYFSV
jgi:hypothetical protein